MKVSDLASLPFQLGSALRQRRFFHPQGVLASGTIDRIAAPGDGLPVESGPVVGRASKALGVPGSLPDAAGLAWRMSAAPGESPWDVLLVTAGLGRASSVVNRLLLHPVTSWSDTPYSSLMPLRYDEKLWWIRARLVTELDAPGLSLDTIVDAIGRGGLEYQIEQACGTGAFEPLARLKLTKVIPATEHPERDTAFDPVRNSAAGVELWPGWLRDFRQSAYQRSRKGRDVEVSTR